LILGLFFSIFDENAASWVKIVSSVKNYQGTLEYLIQNHISIYVHCCYIYLMDC